MKVRLAAAQFPSQTLYVFMNSLSAISQYPVIRKHICQAGSFLSTCCRHKTKNDKSVFLLCRVQPIRGYIGITDTDTDTDNRYWFNINLEICIGIALICKCNCT